MMLCEFELVDGGQRCIHCTQPVIRSTDTRYRRACKNTNRPKRKIIKFPDKKSPCEKLEAKFRRPGDMLSWLICKITKVMPSPGSDCVKRRNQMNEWGWTGCLVHRKQIYGWLASEAENRGVKIDRANAWNLLRQAVRLALRGPTVTVDASSAES